MGLDITVVMADWGRLGRIPAAERRQVLDDAVWPDPCCDACWNAALDAPRGWTWPPGRAEPWCAEYRFLGTTGSYGWHVRLGNLWDDLRDTAAPGLREALDTFAGGLFWPGPDGERTIAPDFPDDPTPWTREPLLLAPPRTVAALADAWRRAEPGLESLRAPFETRCAAEPGRPESFDASLALLREWSAVTAEAARRGWGLIGLPY
ncbi:hypothetical protein ACIRBY_05570 [Streptomyces sp. NPDC096136]|uniref:hypothetical protein n=1 Tax=Streptomyces sp. NPDC096136 TaxID=3366076 RepID=UPI003801059B